MALRQRSKPHGFTLIELLVVISIIGVLATLSVVALNSARAKARDAKRVSDMSSLSNAMQIYFDTNNSSFVDACKKSDGSLVDPPIVIGGGSGNCVGKTGGSGAALGIAATLTSLVNNTFNDPSDTSGTQCPTGGTVQTTKCNYTLQSTSASSFEVDFWEEAKGITGKVTESGVRL